MKTELVEVAALIREASELEPLPASTARLATLVTGEEFELDEVAETIRLDEALTGRLLGAANSARSGARVTVSTVDQAVLRLGPGAVLALALGSGVGARMRQALPGYGLSEGELWRHSVAAALAVERSRRYSRCPVQPEAFAAALLHDLGKLVLSRHLSPETLATLGEARQARGLSMDEAEHEVLGTGHAAIGASVARHWGLPDSICLAIEHHHAPLDAPDERSRRLCSLIRLADATAKEVRAACGEDARNEFGPSIAGSLGINSAGFEALCEDVSRRFDEVLERYGD